MKKRILVIDEVHGILTTGLKDLGFDVSYLPLISRGEMLEIIDGYEGLVVRTKTEIDKEVLCKAGKLKFIARAGSGVDNIDTTWCDTHRIAYFNSGEANADAVGEQALGMLLCVAANIVKADAEVRKMVWDREGNRGWQVKGKTIGIVGYGHTGKAVAKKLSGFGATVLAYDKYLRNYGDAFAKEAQMDEIFADADIITFHVPLTNETWGMVDSSYIGRFSKPIVLLNLSRGKVVNTHHLVDALKSGKVRGAALDVLENEKLQMLTSGEMADFDYLRNSQATVLTPHVGGWTSESFESISEVLLHKIKELHL